MAELRSFKWITASMVNSRRELNPTALSANAKQAFNLEPKLASLRSTGPRFVATLAASRGLFLCMSVNENAKSAGKPLNVLNLFRRLR
jgi:hypothetical protein